MFRLLPSSASTSMRTDSRRLVLRTFLLAGLVAGCESSVEPTREVRIVLDQGGGQGANVGSTLAVAPVVKVLNSQGAPMADVRVNFAIASGGGSITGTSVNTDASGRAALGSWTLGSVGENQVTASVSGALPFVITAVGRCVAGQTIEIDETIAG